MTNERTTAVPAPGHTGLYFYEERLNRLEPATAYPRTEATEVLLSIAKSHYDADPSRVMAATAVLQHGPQDTKPALVFPVDRSRSGQRVEHGAAHGGDHAPHPAHEACPTDDAELQEAAGLYYMLGGLPSSFGERPAGWFWRRAAKILAEASGWSYDGKRWNRHEPKPAEPPPIVVYVVTLVESGVAACDSIVAVASTLDRAKEAASAWARGRENSGVLNWHKDGPQWRCAGSDEEGFAGGGELFITAHPVARPGGP